MTKHLLLATASCALALTSFHNASAQTKTSGSALVELGEIVVTARKRSEDAQSVPITITSLSDKDLEKRSISSFADLANGTPGLFVTTASGGNLQTVYLRGLAPANTSTDLNTDANVGLFIDGIYQTSRNTLDIISVLDVGGIEVAKGPQSALYGRSTFAGAVGISTKRPSHDFSAATSATIGSDEDYRIRGTVSGPLAEGLYGRIAAGYISYDGYGKNASNTSDNLGGYKKAAISGSLEWDPTDTFSARLTGFYTDSKTEPTPDNLFNPSGFNCGTTNAATGLFTLYCGELKTGSTSSLTSNIPDTHAKNAQLSLDMKWDFDWGSLVSVSGLNASQNIGYTDYDVSGTGRIAGVCTLGAACATNPTYSRIVNLNAYSSVREKVRTVSQEIRLQSRDDAKFKWMIGGYYFNSRIPLYASGLSFDSSSLASNERYITFNQVSPAATGVGTYNALANLFASSDPLGTQMFASYTKSATRTTSLFGSVGYSFGKVNVSAEARYNADSKWSQTFSTTAYKTINGVDVPATGTFPTAGKAYHHTFKNVTPRFSIDYQYSPTVFFYGTAAKGVRSGGFNPNAVGGTSGILASEVAYGEEENWTYEAGLKSRLFDRRVLFNAAVFHTDWKNVQSRAYTANPSIVVPTAVILNAGSIKSDGVELQTDWLVNNSITLGGSLTYADPKFQDGAYDSSSSLYCVTASGTAAPGCRITTVKLANGSTATVPLISGNRPTRSVKTQWNLHATAKHAVWNDWMAEGRVDVNYTGSSYVNLTNTSKIGDRTLTNLRLTVSKDAYSVALWATNVFDKTYAANSYLQSSRVGYPSALNIPEIYIGEGRRIGLTVSASY